MCKHKFLSDNKLNKQTKDIGDQKNNKFISKNSINKININSNLNDKEKDNYIFKKIYEYKK